MKGLRLQRLFPGIAPGPHRSCKHLGAKPKNWLCFQSPHNQSLTGTQELGVTPQNQRLAPIIQFVIKSTDLQFSLKAWTLPRGTARILLPADPHFTPPCLEFQKKAEIKDREIWCWLSHLKNCLIQSTFQRHGGSGGTALSRWLSLGTDEKLLYEKALTHGGGLDAPNLSVLEFIKNLTICSLLEFFL